VVATPIGQVSQLPVEREWFPWVRKMSVSLIIGLVSGIFTWCVVLLAHWHHHTQQRRFEHVLKSQTSGVLPPVSILKPIRGVDDGLLENLRAIAQQDYPQFEVVIGIKDSNDPAHAVIAKWRAEFPALTIRTITGFEDIGLNPKVNSLHALHREATHALCLISDADVHPGPNYLTRLVNLYLDREAQLVHSVLLGCDAQTLGAKLDNLQINSFVAANQIALDAVKHPTVVGKSMLFKKEDLDAIGGWSVVKDTLNEDYAVGRRMDRQGMRVALSPDVLPVREPHRSFAAFANRHIRWAQMRRASRLDGYLAELLLNPTAWGLLLFVQGLAGCPQACTLRLAGLSLMASKVLADAALHRSLSGRWLPLGHYPLIIVKDLCVMAFWILGWVLRRVSWRDRQFLLTRGAQLRPIEKS
jgi:ceramide glucosyltransferase